MLKKIWLKIPQLIRSVVLGLLILEIGTRVWSFMIRSNLSLNPEIPLFFPLMAVFLWLMWQYLNGRWFPKSTQTTRKKYLRANKLSGKQLIWGIISGILLYSLLICLTIVSWKLDSFEAGPIRQIVSISGFPIWTIISAIIMTSVVAGVVEEMAFRGYMQKSIEMRHGPFVAIGTVAIIFSMIHLPNAFATPTVLPIFVLGSLGWGVYAYLTDSILLPIVVHTAVDLTGFLWLWLNIEKGKQLAAQSVFNDGITPDFLVALVLTVIAFLGLVYSFRKLYENYMTR